MPEMGVFLCMRPGLNSTSEDSPGSQKHSLNLGKDAADRQKSREENKPKEVMKQIFVNLVGLVKLM